MKHISSTKSAQDTNNFTVNIKIQLLCDSSSRDVHLLYIAKVPYHICESDCAYEQKRVNNSDENICWLLLHKRDS